MTNGPPKFMKSVTVVTDLVTQSPVPGYLSCCRFLSDAEIITSSGDCTW